MTELKDCGCGRSPTGKCIGWHSLSEDEYQEKLKAFEDKKKNKKERDKSTLFIKPHHIKKPPL